MPSIHFKGKPFVQNHHLAVPYHELVPMAKKGLTKPPSLDDNLIVHGDNLLALKALLPTYAGQVKCIYIDPPYNTGKEEWIYNDNVNAPVIREWIGKVVGKEDEDFTRHDKWLCMMMPRLKLLRELMREDGVILISIDDNELANLRLLLAEVFGEENALPILVWNTGHSQQQGIFKEYHQYIVGYARDRTQLEPFGGGEGEIVAGAMKKISKANPASDFTFPAGTRCEAADGTELTGTWGNAEKVELVSGQFKVDDRKLMHDVTLRAGWTQAKQMATYFAGEETTDTRGQKVLEFYFNGSGKLKCRKERERITPSTVLEGYGTQSNATAELAEIFDGTAPLDYPKPVGLVRDLVDWVSNGDDLIMDSFAGSGTTAQAVLDLNARDGGTRRFILVECEEYADKITAERVRRVIRGVSGSKDETLRKGLEGSYSFFDLGRAIETESLLSGKELPTYADLARYIYFTATGEQFDSTALEEDRYFVGGSRQYDIYMYYEPDVEYLKSSALTLDRARALREAAGERPLLVFAPTKYVEQGELDNLKITFCQLPFEIYKIKS